jgi:hypothetical protein
MTVDSTTQQCHRCGRPADKHAKRVSPRSWFDDVPLCAKCALLEKGCPNFKRVHLAGLSALQHGFAIPQIGLTPQDWEYLDAAAPKWVPRAPMNQTDYWVGYANQDYETENEDD